MKKISYLSAVAACAMLTSCYCNKIQVGNVSETERLVHVKSVRNHHFFAGLLVNYDKADDHMEGIKNYVIETKMTFWDAVVSGATFGIYTPNTTKYYVPKSNPRAVIVEEKFYSNAYKGYLK